MFQDSLTYFDMISVIIPTYNASNHISNLLERLKNQTALFELIIIDSQSTDDTRTILKQNNIPFITIPKESFNHGATRNYGISLAKYDNIVFLTQDALPATNDAIDQLINALNSSEDVAMAYGRQLPYPEADIMSQFARYTNYPAKTVSKSLADISTMGIRTCHSSNSFAAYRRADITAIGGFPTNTILGEDVTASASFILLGKKIMYCAEAQVVHSHNYSILEEFKRYFDIGVFHYQQRSVLKLFTKAESEGIRYVLQEWAYLKRNNQLNLIPQQIFRTIAKYIGYRVGYWNRVLPNGIKYRLSMHSSFWQH